MSDGHGHGSAFVPERYVVAEFPTAEALLAGTKQIREKGHKSLDTHTPYPVHGIEDALGLGRARIPKIVLGGALTGACVAYAMMYFMNVIDFPINVANRPPHSAPAFIPITFELTVLLGGISAFIGTLGLAKLPQPYHPVFESEALRRATIDGFFLSVKVHDADEANQVADAARQLGANHVEFVEESER
jgi:hypothetical protein